MSKRSKRSRRLTRSPFRKSLNAALVPAESRFTDETSTVDLQANAAAPSGPKRFSMLAYTGGRLHVNNFDHPVVVDLSGLEARDKRPILLDHKGHQRVGHSDKLINDGRQLRLEGLLSAETAFRDEVHNSSRSGFPWQASIGTRNQATRLIRAGQHIRVNGREFTGPLYVITKASLQEVSFVSAGADEEGATATVEATQSTSSSQSPAREDAAQGISMTFEQWLQANGFDAESLTDDQRTVLRAAYDSEPDEEETLEASETNDSEDSDTDTSRQRNSSRTRTPASRTRLTAAGRETDHGRDQTPVPSQRDLAAEARQAAREENDRIRQITELCAEFDNPEFRVNGQQVQLAAHAIDESWDINRTELECRRISRPASPAGHTRSHDDRCSLQAMEGAFLLHTGVRLDHESLQNTMQAEAIGVPEFLRRDINDDDRQRYMEAAHTFADMSLVDIARECVRLDGRRIPMGRQETIEAAFSGGSLGRIFTTNLNVGILTQFDQTVDTTQGWTVRNTNVPNFQPREVIGMQITGGLKKMGRGGTAEHKTFADKGEVYRIARYAEQLRIDDQDLIDDNYSLFTEVRDQMADDCARLIPDLVYSLIFANANMRDGIAWLHASHGNLRTASPFSAANLKAALTAFESRQENGVNINLSATHIITPRALRWDVQSELRSAEIRKPSATGGGTFNVLQNSVPNAVHDSRLDNGLVDPNTNTTYAGNTTDWLLTDGNRPAIEVGTLRGSGGRPRIRPQPQVAGQWAMGWDVKHDAGTKAIRSETIQMNEA